MSAVKASPSSDVLILTDTGNSFHADVMTINTTTGALTVKTTFVANSSITDPNAIAYDPVFNPSTPFFYIANTGSNNFLVSQAAADGTTNFSSHIVVDSTGPVDLAASPNGNFLYVANNGSSTVSAFMANINGSNFGSAGIGSSQTGSGPESIAVVGHP
jgi:6-phosphogluconolactonase (cycloisomerase 2 family)